MVGNNKTQGNAQGCDVGAAPSPGAFEDIVRGGDFMDSLFSMILLTNTATPGGGGINPTDLMVKVEQFAKLKKLVIDNKGEVTEEANTIAQELGGELGLLALDVVQTYINHKLPTREVTRDLMREHLLRATELTASRLAQSAEYGNANSKASYVGVYSALVGREYQKDPNLTHVVPDAQEHKTLSELTTKMVFNRIEVLSLLGNLAAKGVMLIHPSSSGNRYVFTVADTIHSKSSESAVSYRTRLIATLREYFPMTTGLEIEIIGWAEGQFDMEAYEKHVAEMRAEVNAAEPENFILAQANRWELMKGMFDKGKHYLGQGEEEGEEEIPEWFVKDNAVYLTSEPDVVFGEFTDGRFVPSKHLLMQDAATQLDVDDFANDYLASLKDAAAAPTA